MRSPALRAAQVGRRFGENVAVADVSFEVHAGEVVGLLGANGAGKTTTIRMLLGLLAPTSGRVDIFGQRPDRRSRARLGYVPQNLGLYRELTVAENHAFAASLHSVDAAPLPSELAEYRDVLVRDLPLGTQRQVAFVIALAHHPALLVLDEPTSGVDALTRSRLWDTIGEQARSGVAVLVTTHYMEEAQQCDRLLLMSDGGLVASGSESDIVAGLHTLSVQTADWSDTFTALTDAGLSVILAGTAIRVVGAEQPEVRAILLDAGMTAQITVVPSTIEERMLTLAGTGDAR